jgi:hypothetical protein
VLADLSIFSWILWDIQRWHPNKAFHIHWDQPFVATKQSWMSERAQRACVYKEIASTLDRIRIGVQRRIPLALPNVCLRLNMDHAMLEFGDDEMINTLVQSLCAAFKRVEIVASPHCCTVRLDAHTFGCGNLVIDMGPEGEFVLGGGGGSLHHSNNHAQVSAHAFWMVRSEYVIPRGCLTHVYLLGIEVCCFEEIPMVAIRDSVHTIRVKTTADYNIEYLHGIIPDIYALGGVSQIHTDIPITLHLFKDAHVPEIFGEHVEVVFVNEADIPDLDDRMHELSQ